MNRQLQVKICGMQHVTNITEVARHEPDFMGFIFYNQSPRYVGDNFLIPQTLPSAIKRVGIFVNESPSFILQQMHRQALDFVQLHGDERPEDVELLCGMGVSIIKALRIDANFNFDSLRHYQPYVKYFLLDAKGEKYGGNAVHFDWQLLEKYTSSVPFFLSGGITARDVAEIKSLRHAQLFGVDVNSGVEISPGIKNIEKVQELIRAINEYDHEI